MKTADFINEYIKELKNNVSVKEITISEENNYTFIIFDMTLKNGRNYPCLIVFNNKKRKPLKNNYFNSLEQRDYSLKTLKADIKEEIDRNNVYIENAKEKIQQIKINSILYSSWGYEQTNIDFYMVIERRGITVTLQKIGQNIIERSRNDRGLCMANEDMKIGEPFKKRISKYGYVNLNSYSYASLWDGNSLYWSSYY